MSEPTPAQSAPGAHPRPLSPHLSIYHWHISMALSILHRATGVALSVGLVLLVAWLWSLAYCPEAVDCFTRAGESWIGKVFLIGWTFAFFLHFGNGIRHLVWDTGTGFELNTAKHSGFVVAGWSVLTTAFLWAFLLAS